MSRDNLNKALNSDYIKNLWDKKTYIKMIHHEDLVFKLINNGEVTIDAYDLVNDGDITGETLKYEVIGYDETDNTLYIYITDIPRNFKDVVNLLVDKRVQFAVYNAQELAEGDSVLEFLLEYLPDNIAGTDFQVLVVNHGGNDIIMWEKDTLTLTEFYNSWS